MAKSLSETPKWLQGCLYLMGLFGLVAGLAMVVFGLQEKSNPLLVMGVVLIMVTVPFPAHLLITRYAQRQVGMPVVSVVPQSARVGEVVTVEYTHRFNRATNVRQVIAQLVLREKVRYEYEYKDLQSKTKRREKRTAVYDHVVHEVTSQAGHFGAGQTYQKRLTLRVPKDGMHSFSVPDRSLIWLVRVKVVIPWLPDLVVTKPLTVRPESAQEV